MTSAATRGPARRRGLPGIIPAFLFVAGAAAAGAEEPPPRVEPSTAAPLGQVLEWTSAEGKPYWYRLPKKSRPPAAADLVLMLHGTGLKWGWAFWNYPIAAGSFRGKTSSSPRKA